MVVLAGAGLTYASTRVFGDNQVGTEYANGIQVSSDQIIKPMVRSAAEKWAGDKKISKRTPEDCQS